MQNPINNSEQRADQTLLSSSNSTDSITLVIGHTGKTGSRVFNKLQAAGRPVRGVSRHSEISFHWEDRSTWQAALDGVKAVYITYHPDLAIPRAEADIKHFVGLAKEAGVEHLVLLSGRGEDGAERAEKIVIESGITWNIVRASWFAQNFSEGFMIEGIMTGQMILPASDTLEPFIDIDDIGDVVFEVLTSHVLNNRLFEVSGPRAIHFSQCVDIISEALGRPIQYIPVPIEGYLEGLQQIGMDDDMIWLMRELFTVVFDGRNTQAVDGVEQALGRPATSFEQYVQKTLASGAWDLPPLIQQA